MVLALPLLLRRRRREQRLTELTCCDRSALCFGKAWEAVLWSAAAQSQELVADDKCSS